MQHILCKYIVAKYEIDGNMIQNRKNAADKRSNLRSASSHRILLHMHNVFNLLDRMSDRNEMRIC
jgi:hypothetical protein